MRPRHNLCGPNAIESALAAQTAEEVPPPVHAACFRLQRQTP